MKLGPLSKTGRFLASITLILAIALIIVGTSVSFRNSEWVVFMGVALFLLAGMPAVGELTGRPQSGDQILERKTSSKKISTGLITLSSAAILAVYAAGYERTSEAADRLEAMASSPRRRAAPVAAPVTTAPTAPALETAGAPLSPAPEDVAGAPAPNTSPAPSSTAAAIPNEPAPTPKEGEAPTPAAAAPAPILAGDAATVTAANNPPAVEPAAVTAAAAPPAPAPPQPPQWEYKDGAYWGWGSCRHGDIQVQIVIEAGKIMGSGITKCETRYPCSMIKIVPPQVVERQDPDAIDNVSGATDSVDAYYDAVIDALNKAVK